jgi:hypothetical protein
MPCVIMIYAMPNALTGHTTEATYPMLEVYGLVQMSLLDNNWLTRGN